MPAVYKPLMMVGFNEFPGLSALKAREELMPRLLRSSPFLFMAILASVGCSDTPKKASADDAAAIQHQGNRVIVPAFFSAGQSFGGGTSPTDQH